MSVNEINGVYGKQASEMSLKEKFAVVLETASMDEEQVQKAWDLQERS